MFYNRGKEGVIARICNRKKQSIARATNKRKKKSVIRIKKYSTYKKKKLVSKVVLLYEIIIPVQAVNSVNRRKP